MLKSFKTLMLGLLVGCAVTGCLYVEPPIDTTTGLNGLQQRALTVRNIGYDLGATYDEVWYGTISTLQLNGFILKQADKKSGFIYGVWSNIYEHQLETTDGGFGFTQLSSSPSYFAGAFFGRTDVFKQIDVSVTFQPLAKTQTLVRLNARFDNAGIPMAEGIFANRFFGLLRKEIFLQKNHGSIYQKFTVATEK